ncbi:hypothetical protein [Thiocapsa roseopersicina]|uniref:Uncharacterized protein n=1 Tax=Thiocapsa roseopersicina TaxID=1058 RepID=A0A1H3BTI1_THIRO|nr:hypothetical protein [Thiocapsa roseopersicina]SDX45051.1 hypothetical protein SAMN05421783_1272 [Thiocapsa roseopersicina]
MSRNPGNIRFECCTVPVRGKDGFNAWCNMVTSTAFAAMEKVKEDGCKKTVASERIAHTRKAILEGAIQNARRRNEGAEVHVGLSEPCPERGIPHVSGKADNARSIRASRPWLVHSEAVTQELAQNFIRKSAWWHTHSSGQPVRAPGHASRVYKSHHGWAVDFGANTFLVAKAIARCGKELNVIIDRAVRGEAIDLPAIRQKLMLHIRGAVANNNGNEYAGYYPVSGTDMLLGAQSIDVENGADFVIEQSGIKSILPVPKVSFPMTPMDPWVARAVANMRKEYSETTLRRLAKDFGGDIEAYMRALMLKKR